MPTPTTTPTLPPYYYIHITIPSTYLPTYLLFTPDISARFIARFTAPYFQTYYV